MLSIEITRLIFAAVASVLLGYACYVAAYVKHKNEKRDTANKLALMAKSAETVGGSPEVVYDPSCTTKVDLEKTSTWYLGYRLALLGLVVVSTAVGWAVSWAVVQEYVLTWVEDGALAAAGAIIGGFVLDKYIIHPIADGSFFEKVEDPIVQRFLQDGLPVVEDQVKEKKLSFIQRRKAKKEEKAAKKAAEIGPVEESITVSAAPAEAPEVQKTLEDANVIDISHLSFDEKVKLIETLRRSL